MQTKNFLPLPDTEQHGDYTHAEGWFKWALLEAYADLVLPLMISHPDIEVREPYTTNACLMHLLGFPNDSMFVS